MRILQSPDGNGDGLNGYVKLGLQFGAAAIGIYLTFFITNEVTSKLDRLDQSIATHAVATETIRQSLQRTEELQSRQVDVAIQTCVMLAHANHTASEVCFEHPR